MPLRPADEDVRQVPQRHQPLGARQPRVEDGRIQGVRLGLAVEPAEPGHARPRCRRWSRRLRSMMRPQMARMVPLAMGSRISTLSCQRGASTSSQSAGASSARDDPAVVGDHRRRAVDRIVEVARPDAARADVRRPRRDGTARAASRRTPRSKIVVGPPNQTSACGLTRSNRRRSRISCEPMSSQRTSMSGCSRLEGLLEQGELVAAVGRVDDDRGAAVAAARRGAASATRGQRRRTSGVILARIRQAPFVVTVLGPPPPARADWRTAGAPRAPRPAAAGRSYSPV